MIILIAIIAYIWYKDYYLPKQGPAQQSAIASLATSAQSPDKIRIYKVAGAIVGIYSVIMIWLNFAWYRLYPAVVSIGSTIGGNGFRLIKRVIFTAPILKLYGLTNCCAGQVWITNARR